LSPRLDLHGSELLHERLEHGIDREHRVRSGARDPFAECLLPGRGHMDQIVAGSTLEDDLVPAGRVTLGELRRAVGRHRHGDFGADDYDTGVGRHATSNQVAVDLVGRGRLLCQ